MDSFFTLGIGIALALGYLFHETQKQKLMAALENLQNNLLAANTRLDALKTAVDRIVAAVDPAKEVAIQKAADDVTVISDSLHALRIQIDAAVPPQV